MRAELDEGAGNRSRVGNPQQHGELVRRGPDGHGGEYALTPGAKSCRILAPVRIRCAVE
jgi:hypothetical protein